MGWASGIAAGTAMADSWMDSYNDSALRGKLSELDQLKLEEAQAEPQPTQSPEQGLAPAPKATGYKFGDRTFTAKPQQEYLDAIKADKRAAAFEQHGDPDRAQMYREAAVKQRATAIEAIMNRAVRSGDLRSMVNGYSLIDDGIEADYEVGPKGVTVYAWDEGKPDSRRAILTAPDEATAAKQVMGFIDPELSMKLADAEETRNYRRWQMANGDRSFSADEAWRGAQLKRYDRQDADERSQRGLGMALKYGDPEMIAGSLRGNAEYLGLKGQPLAPKPAAMSYMPIITAAAQEAGVDPLFVVSMLNAESAGDPNAVSPAGAQGLMQLMPGTAREMGVRDPFDPEQNIRAGVKYIKQQFDRFGGDYAKVTAAYNAGPNAFARDPVGVMNIPETKNHVAKVMGTFNSLRGQGGDNFDAMGQDIATRRDTPKGRGGAAGKLPGGLANFDLATERDNALMEAQKAHPKLPASSDLVQEAADKILKTRIAEYAVARMSLNGGGGLAGGGGEFDLEDFMANLAASLEPTE